LIIEGLQFAAKFLLNLFRRVIEEADAISTASLKKINPAHAGELGGLATADFSEFEHFERGHQAEVLLKFGAGQANRQFQINWKRRG
jgi:hypothetical protein